jgi:hypothetical protein
MSKSLRTLASALTLLLVSGVLCWSQQAPSQPNSDNMAELRQEIDQLKKTVASLEERLTAQDKKEGEAQPADGAHLLADQSSPSTINVKELDNRMNQVERHSALDRLNWSGDYRFMGYSYTANIPSHFDGMQLQNLLVRTMFFAQTNQGQFPTSVAQINNNVASKYSDYQYFTNNLTFAQLKTAIGQIPPAMQQQLMQMLMPATYVPGYAANNNAMFTNRLRLNFDAKVADNVTVAARLSMYKVFGNSTGVQVFDGQPTTLYSDGTTVTVPGSDLVHVERAYFTWNNIADSHFYLSVGRRPSTDGPPLNYSSDEPRGGTPSGTLIDYQFDGATLGYHIGDKTTLRACWGVGFTEGYGNGQNLVAPVDRIKGVQLLGGNFDLYSTDHSLVQVTVAHAWNVTDGFNGQIVLPTNPVTGDAINAPVIMRYTPSTNLGGINLYGINLQHRLGSFDLYGSMNFDATRPNGETSPFGGLLSDPFETPVNHTGEMVFAGARFNFPQNDGRTKIGFEFNSGSKYWFNFAQAEDDILAPKTATRGQVYESYLTHRINDHFIFKAGYQRYNYKYSGSGWNVGAPQLLSDNPVLGFPSYQNANVFEYGMMARF